MRETLQPFLAPSSPALQFAAKTLLAAGLALWLAMRLDLGQPQWALMTVFVVSQPLSGMVVVKGLSRLLGTLVGGAVSVLIMGLFAQAPWLLLLAVGLWLGLCIGTTTQLRSAWAYACMLAGYTVVIIVMPALGEPTAVFDHAVARSTEIGLGILCATATSAILWPQHIHQDLLEQARSLWQSGLQTMQETLAGDPQAYQAFLQLLGQIIAVDTQREHAWFEGHQGRQRARAMHGLSRALLRLLRIARAVARLWQQLEPADARALAPWLDEARAILATPDETQLTALRQRTWSAARDADVPPAQQHCLRRLALLLDHLAAAERALQAAEQGTPLAELPAALAVHRDLQSATVFGLRGTLAFLALASFWLATAWTSVTGSLILLAVLCSLFASFDNAVQISLGFLRGVLLALPVAFVVGQVILPQVNGFPLLGLAMGVPLFFGTLGMAHRPTAGVATPFTLTTVSLIAPQNVMHFDTAFFLNESLAMLVAVGCAVLAYQLIGLRDPYWHGRRLIDAGLDDLRRLTQRNLAGSDLWFAGRMADRLLQLARHGAKLPEAQRQHWDNGVALLDLGDELLHLRIALHKAGLRQQRIETLLQQLLPALAQPPAAERADAFDQPCRTLLETLQGMLSSDDQKLAETAVLQLQNSWRLWCMQQREADHGVA